MKLKERFENVEVFIGDTYYNLKDSHTDTAQDCEEISRVFAIDFARYIHNNRYIFNNGWSMEMVLDYFIKNIQNATNK